MTLRTKILVALGLTIVILLVILYLALAFGILSGFAPLLVTGVLVGLASLVVLEWQVLSRLATLNNSLKQITTGGDRSARISLAGSDELAALAANINDMLASLAPNPAQADRTSLLYEISSALGAELDFQAIITRAVELTGRLGADCGEIYIVTDAGDLYFNSSVSSRNELNAAERNSLVRNVLTRGLVAEALVTNQPILIKDARSQDEWPGGQAATRELRSFRSAMCAPISGSQGQLKGALLFTHTTRPDFFQEADVELLKAVAAQLAVALENTLLLNDIRSSLRETHLMLDISRQLAGALNLEDVYAALIQSVMATGADRCMLVACHDLGPDNLPATGEVVLAGDIEPDQRNEGIGLRFPIKQYPLLLETVKSQETLVVSDIPTDDRLEPAERDFYVRYGARSVVINPLVSHSQVVGLISVDYRTSHSFTERELALYRTLCNQTTIAVENARQVQRTEQALAETQTLYRAGRVLAGAADLQSLLEEALIEFLYSIGLEQGGITLVSPDRKYGQLMAYVQDGMLQNIEQLRFSIDENIEYQRLLLSGQPFVSVDVATDPRLVEFQSFNTKAPPRSLLEAPMIIHGETIGWIGADAVEQQRFFTQQEIDLARAMADQIAITIQNRRLLEQARRRAEQLKAVAKVGETVTGLIDLDEIFSSTVDLVRDQFNFYSVSIFTLDEARDWAIIRASAGEAAREMVGQSYRLKVGSETPVGAVTASAEPFLALDIENETGRITRFNNPFLPGTRSEIAVPLLSRGMVIGALDVQSVEANAFNDEDIETLQIMGNHLASAIENARLFEQIQRRLLEQATLYRIGSKMGATLDLQESADSLVVETAEAVEAAECALILLQKEGAYIISDYVAPDTPFKGRQGAWLDLQTAPILNQVLTSKQEAILYADKQVTGCREFDYLTAHNGAVLAVIPVLLRNKVIAFLEVFDHRPHRRIRQEDVALLDSIALQAANAIENARLFETAQESQTFMKAIINQIPDPIFIKDRDHKWLVANKAFAEDLLGLSEEQIIGRTDYDFLPRQEADWSWKQDDKMFETGEIQETEEPISDIEGNVRLLYTRKIPLNMSGTDDVPEYLIGIINDITERKQREAERERLIQETRKTLERTQSLYRISDALATATEYQATFERVLGEYLQLLLLKEGAIVLFNAENNSHTVAAACIDGQPADPDQPLPFDTQLVARHALKKPAPLIDGDTSILLIPLLLRAHLEGVIAAYTRQPQHTYSQSDIEVGEAIARQLTIWLDNRRLLEEAQYRSSRLQTAAEVSRAASSILDINQLIDTSVNLIRDQFDFYYVGLFLVNDTRDWAVLYAGTGEAGQRQLQKGHKLKIGGGSMIGWAIANRKARIALDVGQEAVRFENPDLPETHSEMALPLTSRDEVIGALTVQSTQRGAFSDEDITLLQTMADHLANAIQNARLFAQTQRSLAEAESLYQLIQEFLSAHDEEDVYLVAMQAVAQTDVDSASIYVYVRDGQNAGPAADAERLLEQKAGWAAGDYTTLPNGTRFKASDFVIEPATPQHGPLLVEDVDTSPDLTETARQVFQSLGIRTVLVLPLSTTASRLGFLVLAYRRQSAGFSRQQLRFYATIAQQMVIALENLRLLSVSQRRARREEIIREISGKIRSSINIDDILKTTVSELGKVLDASRGSITLRLDPAAPDSPPALSQPEESIPAGDQKPEPVRRKQTDG